MAAPPHWLKVFRYIFRMWASTLLCPCQQTTFTFLLTFFQRRTFGSEELDIGTLRKMLSCVVCVDALKVHTPSFPLLDPLNVFASATSLSCRLSQSFLYFRCFLCGPEPRQGLKRNKKGGWQIYFLQDTGGM